MAYDESLLLRLVQEHIPPGAAVQMHEESGRPILIAADLDGDGVPEVAAAYRLGSDTYVIVLRYDGRDWKPAASWKGKGYEVSTMQAAPVLHKGRMTLIVGWQVGAIWSELALYDWTGAGWKDMAPPGITFSYMEAEDMPGAAGRDGLAELALWSHDTGQAYRVEVYRENEGKLVPAYDVYPYYFRRVIRYYERLVRQYPSADFYKNYLHDAIGKAGWNSGEGAETELDARGVDLFPATVKLIGGSRTGYVDASGRMAIPPQFEYAQPFQPNGLAVAGSDNRVGAIDAQGHYRIKPIFETIGDFAEGRAAAIDKEGFKVIDESGRVLTPKAYSYIGAFRSGRALASDSGSGHYGYLDTEGNVAIPLRYLEAGDFTAGGKAVVKLGEGQYALIDTNGRTLHTYHYASVGGLGEGLLVFQQEPGGRYGYIDEKGNVVIKPQFGMALPFSGGRAIVNTAADYTNKYGLIDRSGRFVIKPAYNDLLALGERRYALGTAIDPNRPYLGSTYAIADEQGRLLTAGGLQQVGEYRKGLLSVSDGSQTYFLDRYGKREARMPAVKGVGTLEVMGPLIQANVDQRIFYLSPSGEAVWKPDTVIALKPPFEVRELKYKPNKDYLVYYPQIEGMPNPAVQRQTNDKLKALSQVKPIESGQLDYSYTGDFEVSFFRDSLLVLELTGYHFPFGAAHGMPTRIYPHVDLSSGQFYTLSDLFKPGSDYVKVLSGIIGRQIKEDPQYSYVFPDSYKGIAPDQPFYVTEDALHIYFNPYDIAPYAAGFPTFRIPYSELMSIIAVDGAFWRSFHR
ncbi:WG containing repeat-containing protein [Paenibacillus sp. UNCCL117]|uniref:WG repeat-containing protein n=1 Tax=unclassified Paenibacillus TaxID=185978 RepID=UPI000891071A|nr:MULTISPECIES: WG repeat-containing protein [unclassified Paenibacillus]SDC66087.1 WG containing repeat-containing protein [Paenibacillus sp. cl123]SFW22944.1 WG containing repeat-containing protein [Paenibacillus sp. UNCCL117]